MGNAGCVLSHILFSDLMNFTSSSFFATSSLKKCSLMSICFVLCDTCWFLDKNVDPKLSLYIIAVCLIIVNFINKVCVNIDSCAHSLREWYPASVLLKVTVCCFFDVQFYSVPPTVLILPGMLFLSFDSWAYLKNMMRFISSSLKERNSPTTGESEGMILPYRPARTIGEIVLAVGNCNGREFSTEVGVKIGAQVSCLRW
jgi:hypothetical protein